MFRIRVCTVQVAKDLLLFALSMIFYGMLSTAENCFSQQSQEPLSPTKRAGIEFILIPGGSFQMGDFWGDGSERDRPVHPVSLSAFEMSKYEITNAQFCDFLNEKGNQKQGSGLWLNITNEYCLITEQNGQFIPKEGYGAHPVVEVSWFGATAFAEWIGGRLPTEAEWEYAAREGGKLVKFPSGNTLTHDDANFAGKGDRDQWEKTSPVGSFPPNTLGLYDMAGNVWEWCSDWFGSYSRDTQINPTGPRSGERRVVRGGGYHFPEKYSRVSYRVAELPAYWSFENGFRVVHTIQ